MSSGSRRRSRGCRRRTPRPLARCRRRTQGSRHSAVHPSSCRRCRRRRPRDRLDEPVAAAGQSTVVRARVAVAEFAVVALLAGLDEAVAAARRHAGRSRQASVFVTLPSSHSSPACTMPSPQHGAACTRWCRRRSSTSLPSSHCLDAGCAGSRRRTSRAVQRCGQASLSSGCRRRTPLRPRRRPSPQKLGSSFFVAGDRGGPPTKTTRKDRARRGRGRSLAMGGSGPRVRASAPTILVDGRPRAWPPVCACRFGAALREIARSARPFRRARRRAILFGGVSTTGRRG